VAIQPGGTQAFHVDPAFSVHLAARVPQLSLQGRPLLLSHGPAAVHAGAARAEDLPEWFRLTFTAPPEPPRRQQASGASMLEGGGMGRSSSAVQGVGRPPPDVGGALDAAAGRLPGWRLW
jgi:hypothetical protein